MRHSKLRSANDNHTKDNIGSCRRSLADLQGNGQPMLRLGGQIRVLTDLCHIHLHMGRPPTCIHPPSQLAFISKTCPWQRHY